MAVLPTSLNDFAAFDVSILLSFAKLLFFIPTISLVIYIALNEVVRLRARIPNLPGPLGYPLFGSIPSLRGTATSDEYRIVRNVSSHTPNTTEAAR